MNPVPSAEWDEEYNSLLSSKHPFVVANGYFYMGDWLRRKTQRSRRLAEASEYIDKHAAELLQSNDGCVIDVGPGPGEFLELARHYGHPVLGIDSENGQKGMGFAYLRVSQLMCHRQQIPVRYCGFFPWLYEDDEKRNVSASFVNFRGSIEQVCAHRMEGDHRFEQDCRTIRWKEGNQTLQEFEGMFARLRMLLKPNGCVLIHANGSADDRWYDEAIQMAARRSGLSLEKREGLLLHKWRRA